MNAEKSPSEVKSYYDEFLTKRMVEYRLSDNLRITTAIDFFREHLTSKDVVVDIGCGIGIATEAAAKIATEGKVFGFDISEKNVWYARKTIDLPNLTFSERDILATPSELDNIVGGKVDIFIMSDVIEHLPASTRSEIFGIMARIGSPRMKVLLTYPTPGWQDHLRANKPQELQVIDENIELDQLIAEATPHGLSVSYYALKDVWRGAQYVHCVLQQSTHIRSAVTTYFSKPKGKETWLSRKLAAMKRRRLKRKYVTDVFGKRK